MAGFYHGFIRWTDDARIDRQIDRQIDRRGASNEYPQHMFLWRNKKNYPTIITKYSSLTSLLPTRYPSALKSSWSTGFIKVRKLRPVEVSL